MERFLRKAALPLSLLAHLGVLLPLAARLVEPPPPATDAPLTLVLSTATATDTMPVPSAPSRAADPEPEPAAERDPDVGRKPVTTDTATLDPPSATGQAPSSAPSPEPESLPAPEPKSRAGPEPAAVANAARTAPDRSTRPEPIDAPPEPDRANAPGDVPPSPSAADASGTTEVARATYRARLSAELERVRRYPRGARRQRLEGSAALRFTIGRDGALLERTLVASSGHAALDEETLALPARAAPLPPMPAELAGETLTLEVPVTFRLR